MRTIKFRGKTELTGEWVYGFYTMGGIDIIHSESCQCKKGGKNE